MSTNLLDKLVLLMRIIGLVLGIATAPLFPLLGIKTMALILTCFMFPIIPLVIFYIPESHGIDLKMVE